MKKYEVFYVLDGRTCPAKITVKADTPGEARLIAILSIQEVLRNGFSIQEVREI